MALPVGVRILPMHDPSALGEVVGDSAVVGIGENAHYVREFALLRAWLVRTLVTELGFGVVAAESGFAESALVDDWIRGGPGAVELVARDGFTFRHGDLPEVQEMLRWLREHNAIEEQVRFVGLDVPGSGGSTLPALRRVAEFLAARAPEALFLVDAAIAAARSYVAANNGAAPAAYAALTAGERDAATAALTRLWLRVAALPSGSDPTALRVARHHALGALRLDEQLRELVDLVGETTPRVASSSRDVYQADTVRLLRELHGPGARIVLLMHNAHVQRTPMELLPGVRFPSMGSYLADELRSSYLAIGMTALAGETAEMRLDDDAPDGIAVAARSLDPPAHDSVERAVTDSGYADDPVLLDLRPARGGEGPTRIRHGSTHVPVDVLAAFDALACLPQMHVSRLDDRTGQAD